MTMLQISIHFRYNNYTFDVSMNICEEGLKYLFFTNKSSFEFSLLLDST